MARAEPYRPGRVASAYTDGEPATANQVLEVRRMANALEDLLVATLLRGRLESRREDIVRLLTARFGVVPEAIRACIERVDDPDRLKDLVIATATVTTLQAFDHALQGLGG
jgi:hypothetical protein